MTMLLLYANSEAKSEVNETSKVKLFINTATAILLFVLVMFVSEIKNSEVMKSYKGVIQTHRVLMQF